MTKEPKLRLTIVPCEAFACPNDATWIVTDNGGRQWHVCDQHVTDFPPRHRTEQDGE